MRPPIVSLVTILLVSNAIQPGIAVESRFPNIKTDCKTYFQARKPIDLYGIKPGFRDRITVEEEQQIRNSLSNLIQDKQWDQALVEIEKLSFERLRDEISIELIEAMSRSREMDRALLALFRLFPEKTSYERAKGIGIIAKHKVLNDQFSQALETLSLLSDNEKWHVSVAVIPVVNAILIPAKDVKNELATPEQLAKILKVISLFPKTSQLEGIWVSIGEDVQLIPEVARQITELTSDSNLKLLMLERLSRRWFNPYPRSSSFYVSSEITEAKRFEYGREIANNIDNCVVRSKIFLELADQVVESSYAFSSSYISRRFTVSDKSQMLDQMESLLNAIDQNQVGDRRIVTSQKLMLVELNTKIGRRQRSLELLEQSMNDQKQFKFNADRAEILLEIASHYEKLNRRQNAIQVLETAEVATQMAYVKNEDAFNNEQKRDYSNIGTWRIEKLDTIGYGYKRLQATQKVAELERSRCTPSSPESLSRIRGLISAGVVSPSVLRMPGYICRSL